MSQKLIQKCVEELKKDDRRIDYVLGMLEAMLEAPEVVRTIAVEPVVRPEHTQVFVEHKEETPTAPVEVKKKDPTGELETPEERAKRLGAVKVPPAFLGDTRRMLMDPGKTGGMTDVTPVK